MRPMRNGMRCFCLPALLLASSFSGSGRSFAGEYMAWELRSFAAKGLTFCAPFFPRLQGSPQIKFPYRQKFCDCHVVPQWIGHPIQALLGINVERESAR